MSTRISRNATPSKPSRLSEARMDNATWSCFPQTSSLGTKTGDGTHIHHGSSAYVAYQITDLTHYHIPESSSILTATVRCNEANLSLNPVALYHKLLCSEDKVIRITQLSSDSWMLLGCRDDNGASSICDRERSTLLNTNYTSSSFSGTASDNTDHIDDDGHEEDEESFKEYRPHGASNGQRLKAEVRFRKRTRTTLLESDDLQLLAYRNEMKMEWKDIFKVFPDRTLAHAGWVWTFGPRTPKDGHTELGQQRL
ncbi:hypothetical protein GQ44DRAFT_811119 [Phaeosphaeriaceae sp. PMI808]|nr:hypothetical protein GQ44DRAFT_811119 [Phaeosphaeriaceae sp. PMI808]